MIFLPATFTAVCDMLKRPRWLYSPRFSHIIPTQTLMMAVPQTEKTIDTQEEVFGVAAWLWYAVLSLIFTGLVLVLKLA